MVRDPGQWWVEGPAIPVRGSLTRYQCRIPRVTA
jgi:hypothetical protein